MKRNNLMGVLWLPTLLGLAYVALCGYTYLMQDHLIYYPDSSQPSSAQIEAAGVEPWPLNNSSFSGYVSTRGEKQYSGLVVVFHGNAGSAWQRNYYNEFLEPLGFRVVLAEYPGYGGRPGNLGEKSFVSDAKETVRLAHLEFGGPIFLCGESLGAAVAAAVAADPPTKIDGIILITPWDTLADLAQKHYWYLPVRWLARDRYDNITNLGSFTGRTAVILAEHDEIVPTGHGTRLFASLKGPKKLWSIKGAGHNSWTYYLNPRIWLEIAKFIREGELN